jgi:hypothetical protein
MIRICVPDQNLSKMLHRPITRRQFAAQAAVLGTALGSASYLQATEEPSPIQGKADACIFLWLGGGACHIDTWDPKRKGDGKKVAGSYYDAIDTAIPGVQVCQHLQRTAKLLDRCVLIRSAHHDVIDEHAAATNRVHTGRPTTGTTAYPSIGSLIAHEKGAAADDVPAYVLVGYPSSSRGPGYLGAKYSYIYLTDTEAGPAGLRRPEGVSTLRQSRRDALLAVTRKEHLARHPGDSRIEQYGAAGEAALALTGTKFMSVFDLTGESSALRAAYGGEFGQRCLLARRLVESGVRFVEVSFNLNFINGTGWDTHNEGQQNQHILIQQLDEALAALLTDLEKRDRLSRTLVVVATEFGRPPEFDAGGGRGHQSQAFSMVLAGGGLKTGQVIGETDELGKKVVNRPVSIPDFHATIHASLGIDYAKELYDGERPIPITDQGQPIRELFG